MRRWDKYESKTLYWVEEELEAEYATEVSRTTRQQTEYETQTDVATTLDEASLPPALSMGDVREPETGPPISASCLCLPFQASLEHLVGVARDQDLQPGAQLLRSRSFRRTRSLLRWSSST